MGGARGVAARGLAQKPVKESAGAQMDSRTILEEDRHGNTVTTLERSGSQYGPKHLTRSGCTMGHSSGSAADGRKWTHNRRGGTRTGTPAIIPRNGLCY